MGEPRGRKRGGYQAQRRAEGMGFQDADGGSGWTGFGGRGGKGDDKAKQRQLSINGILLISLGRISESNQASPPLI
ncbi:hypothetical protein E2562_037868 [Oryza meyeriana var. granulata]|uniref:Uncharacterized protein n=1 Tax=Oryza meyeriana var. granulata TaxID=110450 RepID=A0A6G1ETV7_9ORYZ|nr:hypothetical protein E2562_037868 [Oryza meyeriana var. granulata]